MSTLFCPFCAVDAPEVREPATVLAPQGSGLDTRWVPACADHWSTWWDGGDDEFHPDRRPPAFLIATLAPGW